MGILGYYDKESKPISFERWLELTGDLEYKIVAKTKVGTNEVSTVWLGMNHNWGRGPPLIFETLVFPACDDMYRYATLEQALNGHETMVQRYKANMGN